MRSELYSGGGGVVTADSWGQSIQRLYYQNKIEAAILGPLGTIGCALVLISLPIWSFESYQASYRVVLIGLPGTTSFPGKCPFLPGKSPCRENAVAPSWAPWAPNGLPRGPLGHPMGPLVGPLGTPWAPQGGPFGHPVGPPFPKWRSHQLGGCRPPDPPQRRGG